MGSHWVTAFTSQNTQPKRALRPIGKGLRSGSIVYNGGFADKQNNVRCSALTQVAANFFNI